MMAHEFHAKLLEFEDSRDTNLTVGDRGWRPLGTGNSDGTWGRADGMRLDARWVTRDAANWTIQIPKGLRDEDGICRGIVNIDPRHWAMLKPGSLHEAITWAEALFPADHFGAKA